jgi:hypothetical protein
LPLAFDLPPSLLHVEEQGKSKSKNQKRNPHGTRYALVAVRVASLALPLTFATAFDGMATN